MTDSFEFQNCPKCGKENLAHMTHCVHCGAALEDLFHFEGQVDIPADEQSEGASLPLPFIFDELEVSVPDEKTEADAEDETPPATPPDGEEIDWLERVRQRARSEEDATGLLIRDLNNRQDILDDKRDDAESQYKAWLEEVRENTEREKARQARRLQSSPVDEQGVPEWLRRIRALNPRDGEEGGSTDPEDEWTDEELEELRKRELGDDYVALEKEATEETADAQETEQLAEEDTQELEIEHNIPEDDDDLAVQPQPPASTLSDNTGFVMVGDPKLDPQEVFVTEEPKVEQPSEEAESVEKTSTPRDAKTREAEKEALLQDLVILRGQHEKVALLKALISDEGKPVINSAGPEKKEKDHSRLFLGLIFIVVLLLSILFFPKTIGEQPQPAVSQVFFTHYLDGLKKSDEVLVVMSYYSASAPELEALAAPVLARIDEKGLVWHAITLRMDGLWQAENLYEKAGLTNRTAPEYVPGGQFAMLALAVKSDGVAGPGWQKPLTMENSNLTDFDLVLLITDSALSLRGWLEQVAPNAPFIKTLAIISEKEVASIQPFFDNGQVLGYLNGKHGLDGEIAGLANHYRAYQVGLVLMILWLGLGLFFAFQQAKQKKTPSGAEQ